jgi:hypothetical protein
VSLVAGQFRAQLFDHVPDTGLMGIETRQQTRAGRTASGGVVKLGEPQSIGCQFIQVRGMDFTSIAADIGKAHVVSHNNDDIGAILF